MIVCVCMSVCVCVCMSVCACVCMSVCMSVCVINRFIFTIFTLTREVVVGVGMLVDTLRYA